MNQAATVANPSDYWSDYEGERYVYYFFEWTKTEALSKFLSNEDGFIEGYMNITRKFRMVDVIYRGTSSELQLDYAKYAASELSKGRNPLNRLYYIYKHNNILVYPSLLFTGQKFEEIISISPFQYITDLEKASRYNSAPLKVQMTISEQKITLDCYLDNDIFLDRLYNNKTKLNSEAAKYNYAIDNNIPALINGARLNSFLRDLKLLCMKYGADDFRMENTLDANPERPEYFTEEGVKTGGNIHYYEDILKQFGSKYQV